MTRRRFSPDTATFAISLRPVIVGWDTVRPTPAAKVRAAGGWPDDQVVADLSAEAQLDQRAETATARSASLAPLGRTARTMLTASRTNDFNAVADCGRALWSRRRKSH